LYWGTFVMKPDLKKANPIEFLKEAKIELSKVVWPTRKETIRLTSVVIGVSIAVGFFLGSLDFIFTQTISFILKR
jgi:preprotein translocase subunit SecE